MTFGASVSGLPVFFIIHQDCGIESMTKRLPESGGWGLPRPVSDLSDKADSPAKVETAVNLTTAQEMAVRSKKRFHITLLIIIAFGVGMSFGIHAKQQQELRAAVVNFRQTESESGKHVASIIEHTFEEIYHSLRTMARLPGVRSIDRYAQNFDDDAHLTMQELYNTMASEVAVSETYIIPLDFEPDLIDPHTGKLQAPIITYDELIINRHAGQEGSEDDEETELEEIEIYEYRLMKQQIAWFREHYPRETDVDGLVYPLLSGPEVVTCDNSRFDPADPDDLDRSGLVISVPFYSPEGDLKGLLSGVILTDALRDMLPGGDYGLMNLDHDYLTLPKVEGPVHQSDAFVQAGKPDPNLVYSEVITLDTPFFNDPWNLWSGRSNEVFEARPEVLAAHKAAMLEYAGTLVLMAGMLIVAGLVRRNHLLLAAHATTLETGIRERTAHLEASQHNLRDALKDLHNIRFAMDEHAFISITDVRGNIIHTNEKFCEISGYTRDELIGQNHRLVKSDEHDDAFYRDLWRTIAMGTVWRGEICNQKKNGGEYWVEATIVPFKDEQGKNEQYVAIRTDITPLKAAQEEAMANAEELEAAMGQLKAAMEEVEAASRAKSEFLANMSHEIRTPMTAILGYTDLLKEIGDIKLAPKDRVEAIDTIQRNGNHLLTIINDILDISKLEAGMMTLECIDTSPAALLNDVVELMKVRAEGKGLTLAAEFSGPIPDIIQSDPTRLRQILVNLVGNSIKFTETGSVRLVARLDESTREPQLVIEVIDTGIGMNEEQMAKVFGAFEQADTSTTREHGGTGLGLALSRRLARLLGGEIGVACKPNEGCVFFVAIGVGDIEGVSRSADFEKALAAFRHTSPKDQVEQASDTSLPLDGMRILLAEDGPDNQRLISFHLKRAGAEVEIAENGQIALDSTITAEKENRPFQVILMDMQMPVLDGYTATTRLREKGYARPIIALTAHAMASDRQKCLDAGCDDYTTKPIDKDALIALVSEYAQRSPRGFAHQRG